MRVNALFFRLMPLLYFLGLLLLSLALHFNGLYGQDAHEYLRQSLAIFDRLQGLPPPSYRLADTEFASGYPLAGALLRILLGHPILSMQIVSWLAAAAGLLVLERLLALLSPGARADSRWAFVGLGLAVAPLFLRAGLTCMSDGLGLLLALSAVYFSLRLQEKAQILDAVMLATLATMAITTRFALAGLMLPVAGIASIVLLQKRRWLALIGMLIAGMVSLLPHFWLKEAVADQLFAHSMFQHWSVGNYFQNTFSNENGLSAYPLPNLLYLLYPFAHPAFCVALPGLFFLFKKTDLVLAEKRTLLFCILFYLLFIGGFPHQNLRFHLPAYALLLLLLFPAWDRLYCYGFIFFRRLTLGLLMAALALQLFFSAKYLSEPVARNRLERAVAAQLQQTLPPRATLFAFDLDISLHTYLNEMSCHNLWERRYSEFPVGSFVLFNEALRPQWQGQNPVMNWDFLNANYQLELRAELPQGWVLWEIR